MNHPNGPGSDKSISKPRFRKLRWVCSEKMRNHQPQNSRSKNQRISKMYGTDVDDKSDTIYSKQSDQNDYPN